MDCKLKKSNERNFIDEKFFVIVQFAELLNIQRRLGVEQFPLIHQAYYPNHREMVKNEETFDIFLRRHNQFSHQFESLVDFTTIPSGYENRTGTSWSWQSKYLQGKLI